MWSFYEFMMSFLSITMWKNIIGPIFSKIWSVLTFFKHSAHKPEQPSPDEADFVPKPEQLSPDEADFVANLEHPSQDEVEAVHGQNLSDHKTLETLISELVDAESLAIEIRAQPSRVQFKFRNSFESSMILAETEDREAYFAVVEHISSSMKISALKMTLELGGTPQNSSNEFQPWHSSDMLSEHEQKEIADYIEAFWKALASNASLDNVHVYVSVGYFRGGSFTKGSGYRVSYWAGIVQGIAMVLYGNKTIVKLVLVRDGPLSVEDAHILSRALFSNRTLKTLVLHASSYNLHKPLISGANMKILLEPFSCRGDGYNNVLEHLSLYPYPTDDDGVKHIAAMLKQNDSLKSVAFLRVDVDDDDETQNGFSMIGDALFENRRLQHLIFHSTIIGVDEWKALLNPLERDDSGSQANTSLDSLHYRCRLGQVEFECLISMIQRNTSLIHLDVGEAYSFKNPLSGSEENVCLLLDALKRHPSIESLSIRGHSGVQGDKVLGTFMDLLLENNHLQEVDLWSTPLERSGNAEKIQIELKRRREENSWEIIKDLAKAHANSGRIFLCGDGEAGKTTLCDTMKAIHAMKVDSESESFQSKILQNKTYINERTRGIEVHNLPHKDLDLTIWDMAGQEEYHSFHDLVIPNLSGAGIACTFILVHNAQIQEPLEVVRSKLRYWLQFIASNTRKSRLYRPRVTITMTHYDLGGHDTVYYGCLEDEVKALKEEFDGLLEFDASMSFYSMDARQPDGDATRLFEFLIGQMRSLLKKLPFVLKACCDLQTKVKSWKIQHEDTPFLTWDDFSSKLCEQVEELKAASADSELVERRRKLVAQSLHDGGHIIYNEDTHFVITNPHWFCHDVMGELLSQFHVRSKIISKGSITSAIFKRILSSLNILGDEHHAYTENFVSMMKKLQICYDQGDGTLMVPSTLPQNGDVLKWSSSRDTTPNNHIGRRLAPQDMQRTMLSAGFFPRLQVYYQGKIEDDNTRKSYKLTKDTISFIENGKEVIIQYDGHIDVMVRSRHDKDILLQIVKKVFQVIYELLANPTLGCPGVVLVECVLQPLCVQELIKKEQRRDQFVLLESLKGEVLKCYDLNYCHNWNGFGCDYATELLDQEEWADILERRRRALAEINTKAVSKLASTSASVDATDHGTSGSESDTEAQDPIVSEISKKLDAHHSENMSNFAEIKTSLAEMKSIVAQMKGLVQQQDMMLYDISASINESMQFSVELQKTHIPRLAYFAFRPRGGKRQLLTEKLMRGLTTCDLHFFCEYIGGVHEVVGQKGCPVHFGTKDTKRVMCLLKRGLLIATIITKVVAHVGGGMGSLVPDLAQVAALVLDTPGLLDHQSPSTSSVHIISEDLRRRQFVIPDEDMKDAQQWLINIVNSQRHEIHGMFGLNRVKYNRRSLGDHMKNLPSIAWVCDKHKSEGSRSGMLEPLSLEIQL